MVKKKTHNAFVPPNYEISDAKAIQAVTVGKATAEQQIRAMEWIIRKAAATYDFPFRPGGQDGERETSLALGRMFVGQQIVKMIHLNIEAIIQEKNTESYKDESKSR